MEKITNVCWMIWSMLWPDALCDMTEFVNALVPFVYGFAIGFFYNPLLKLFKRIVEEIKTAKKEW